MNPSGTHGVYENVFTLHTVAVELKKLCELIKLHYANFQKFFSDFMKHDLYFLMRLLTGKYSVLFDRGMHFSTYVDDVIPYEISLIINTYVLPIGRP